MEKGDIIENNNEKIDRARQISDMMNTKGWKVVEEMIDINRQNLINSNKKELENNFLVYNVLKNFINSLDDMVNDAEQAIKDNDKLNN